jgi:hypothetical protein
MSTAQEQQYPPAIDPKAGTVEGIVEGFDQAPTRFAANAIIVRLRDKDGHVGSLWLTSTVLKSQFSKVRPKVGENVRVTYLGMREGANGSYHDYRVEASGRPPFQPNWDALSGDSEDDAPYSSGPPLEYEAG